jgi:glycosyltransferase involved in cell wall biosynthesis
MDIIVVDDGSVPPVKIPPNLGKYRVILLRNSLNSGITKSLNLGLTYIIEHGYRFVARLDAGDIPVNGRFSKQMNFLSHNSSYGLVGSRVEYFGKDTIFLNDKPSVSLKRELHLRNNFSHPAVMFRVDAVKKAGFYNSLLNGCEDWDLWFRIAQHYEIKNLPEMLTYLDCSYDSLSREATFRKRIARRVKNLFLLVRYFRPGYWESYAGILYSLLVVLTNIILPPSLIIKRRHFRGFL